MAAKKRKIEPIDFMRWHKGVVGEYRCKVQGIPSTVFAIDKPLTPEQMQELQQFENVLFGNVLSQYAPEIRRGAVVVASKCFPFMKAPAKVKKDRLSMAQFEYWAAQYGGFYSKKNDTIDIPGKGVKQAVSYVMNAMVTPEQRQWLNQFNNVQIMSTSASSCVIYLASSAISK